MINGQQADYLTGREYKTQWYSSSVVLLKEKTYDWSWEETDSETEGTLIGYNSGGTLSNPYDVAVSPDGYVICFMRFCFTAPRKLPKKRFIRFGNSCIGCTVKYLSRRAKRPGPATKPPCGKSFVISEMIRILMNVLKKIWNFAGRSFVSATISF